jgi:hypothetical protein
MTTVHTSGDDGQSRGPGLHSAAAGGIEAGRAAWSTPHVIVSQLRNASANVTNGADGSSSIFGPYGS